MARGTLRGWAAVIAATALAIGPAACSKEGTLGAEEFVDMVNAQGVELTLGEELESGDETKEHLYAVDLTPVKGAPAPVGDEGEPETGGSLSVYEDSGAADEGLRACRVAGDLLCYQAGNIVVILEGGGIAAQQLGVAIQKLDE
jgi:hypothetical protein